MAKSFNILLCRTLNQVLQPNRIAINPLVVRGKLNKSNVMRRYCSSMLVVDKKLTLPKFELPKELTEEIEDELVPTENFPVYVSPTFNFAAYIDKSETLQKFVELGIDLSKIEKKKGLPQYVLTLDFNRDVKSHLLFLNDLQIPPEHFGHILTKNPLFFKNSLDDLETRVFYLRSKNFSFEQVQTIVIKDPFWLNFSTKRIDRRLGWFQKNFGLIGDDIRFLATKFPRVVTSNLMHVRDNSFSIREEMGFDKDETKILLLAVPKLFMRRKESIRECFDYVHNVMKFSHDKILNHPQILNSRLSRLKSRHQFLKLLGRDQFDEKLPRYVSPQTFYGSSDEDFVINTCESAMEMYDNFLKTL